MLALCFILTVSVIQMWMIREERSVSLQKHFFIKIISYSQNPTQTPVLYSRDNSPRIVNRYRNRIDTDSGKPSARRIYTPPTSTSTTTTTTTTTTTPRPTAPAATTSIPRQKLVFDYFSSIIWKIFSFALFLSSQKSPHRFIWWTNRWSSCSASCDGGYRVWTVRCVSESTNQVVDDRYCVDEKPVGLANCAQQRCTKWRTGAWGSGKIKLQMTIYSLPYSSKDEWK